MRFLTFQTIGAAVALFVTTAHGQDGWKTICFTNATVITNSRVVFSALNSGDTRSKATVQALIGSQVAFSGYGPRDANYIDNLIISSNIVLDVELQSPRDMRLKVNGWTAEVSGTLKTVDFEKRIIYIKAKPENWKEISGE